ncbi:MAG: hypothetical protein R6X02_35800 [Enhygromyxa sp.]
MVPASLLAALLAASPPGSSSALEWEAPLGCPGVDWLDARLEAYLGRPLAALERREALAQGLGGRVRSGEDGRFELELELGEARHHLADHDCRRLADSAASVLAIAIDPLALGGPVVPLEEAEPAILVPPIEPPVVDQGSLAPQPRSSVPEPVTWELRAGTDEDGLDQGRDRGPSGRERSFGRLRGLLAADAGLALGLFPNPAPQVHARVGFDLHEPDARLGLRVELDGGAALGGRFRASDGRELGGDLIAWDLALRPCAVPRWGRVDLRACAGAGAGQLRARGVGVVDPQQVAQPWVWAGADLGLAVALHRRDAQPRLAAALVLDLGAGLNLLRPNFAVLDHSGGPDIAYVMPIAFGRGRLGIELRFF